MSYSFISVMFHLSNDPFKSYIPYIITNQLQISLHPLSQLLILHMSRYVHVIRVGKNMKILKFMKTKSYNYFLNSKIKILQSISICETNVFPSVMFHLPNDVLKLCFPYTITKQLQISISSEASRNSSSYPSDVQLSHWN